VTVIAPNNFKIVKRFNKWSDFI